jgi:hypothetical protein
MEEKGIRKYKAYSKSSSNESEPTAGVPGMVVLGGYGSPQYNIWA